MVTAENVADYELVFDGHPCGNCHNGTWSGYASSGVCFQCNGAGRKFTPAGKRARSRYLALMRAIPEALRDDIRPGDRVFVYVPRVGKQWVTIAEIRDEDMTENARRPGLGGTPPLVGPDEVYIRRYFVYQSPDGTTIHAGELTGQDYTVPRWDPERVAEIYNQVAALKGATCRLRGNATAA